MPSYYRNSLAMTVRLTSHSLQDRAESQIVSDCAAGIDKVSDKAGYALMSFRTAGVDSRTVSNPRCTSSIQI